MASDSGRQFLLVCAHPDDETLFGGVIYKLTRNLGAKVDVIVVTNGEGGFRYSTLGGHIYDKQLTEETIAREHLPSIRKKEMLGSASVLGIRDVYFLDEKDHRYTQDIKEILDTTIWDCQHVKSEIRRIVTKNKYHYVFVMLPDEEQHAHHKLSCLFTLEVLNELKEAGEQIPIVLAGTENYDNYTAFSGYESLSRVVSEDSIRKWNISPFLSNSALVKDSIVSYTKPGSLVFQFDRRQGFGAMKKLTYQIPVVWAAAEHKSQGMVLFETLPQDIERYWVFEAFTNEKQLIEIYNLFKTLNNELQ